MNRYIITRETIRGQEYIISALYDEDKKMLEVTPSAVGDISTLGNIYIGKVENVVHNLNAAFVKISPTQTCYLSLDDCKNAIFTKKLSDKKALVAGEELLVQVSREALKTKDAAVTANLSFAGKYAVLTTGNKKRSVSSKLSRDVRRHYLERLEEWKADYGIIIRTNAASAPDESILGEIAALERRCRQLITTARYKTCYSVLYKEEPSYLRHLADLKEGELEAVITDDREIFEQICEKYGIFPENLVTGTSVSTSVDDVAVNASLHIRYYRDEMLSLSSLYSVKTTIEDALKARVWLKSGAYLIIEPTEALTVIDVNTGKNIAKKDMQENFLKVNREAAEEITRQLRLRNISGIVVVDFINLSAKEAQEELLRVFRSALKRDPIPTQLVDMTGLGLVEVTRKKVKKPLSDIFSVEKSAKK